MAERGELTEMLRLEHERATPHVWPSIRRRVAAVRTARALLAELEGPPSPRGRLRWEALARLEHARLRKAV